MADEAPHANELAVEATRDRVSAPPRGRERWASLSLSFSLVVTAGVLAAFGLAHGSPSWPVVAAYAAAYAVALAVEFETALGSAVPTELVLVPLLFAVHPYLVPAVVAAGFVGGGLIDLARGRVHAERILVAPASAWHAVGPALVLGLLAPGAPRASHWPVYLLALLSQFAVDFAATAARHVLAFGAGPRSLVPPMLTAFAVDATLAPVALLAAAGDAGSLRPLLLLPLVGLLAFLAYDRRDRIDRSIELGRAYVGATAKARTDPLTGVGNRLAWEEAIAAAAAEVEAGAAFGVVLVDVDGLKTANDQHGHAFGDRILAATGHALAAAVRAGDVVARIGGDEFAVLAPALDPAQTAELADRIRQAIRRERELGLSASVGSAAVPPCATLEEALFAADSALYAEKAASRRLAAVR
jgi:diguanylate cyclase (GGDEF)-like protein